MFERWWVLVCLDGDAKISRQDGAVNYDDDEGGYCRVIGSRGRLGR